MKLNKLSVVLLAMFIALFTVSSASAYVLNSRSEEMTAFSTCDFAGTIQLFFSTEDQTIINSYLGEGNTAVVLRVSLSGTDIALDSDAPLLCKPIAGNANLLGGDPDFPADVTPPNNPALPAGMVALDELGVEVSEIVAAGTADITAYVKGVAGQQFFTIYITQMTTGDIPAATPIWLRVGLYDELLAIDQPQTAICANVKDFSGFSKLTVSIDNTPQTLTTTTSENQIGHFLVESVELRDCAKDELKTCSTTKSIELCKDVEGQTDCLNGTACFVAEGDLPLDETFVVQLRTNGDTKGATTQDGVYIGGVSFYYYDADGVIQSLNPKVEYYNAADEDEPLEIANPGCGDKVILAKYTFGPMDIGSRLQFCVRYLVDPDDAAPGTKARIWTTAGTLPCGNLWSGIYEAADLVECGGTPSCMYFPYVVSGIPPWATGVVVTNLASADVPAADMIVTFTMTDATGAVFTATKDDFDSVVYSFVVDDVLEAFGWTPAPGNAWLKVNTNFTVDGYSFLTNGGFGAGTLARPCGDNHVD